MGVLRRKGPCLAVNMRGLQDPLLLGSSLPSMPRALNSRQTLDSGPRAWIRSEDPGRGRHDRDGETWNGICEEQEVRHGGSDVVQG